MLLFLVFRVDSCVCIGGCVDVVSCFFLLLCLGCLGVSVQSHLYSLFHQVHH